MEFVLLPTPHEFAIAGVYLPPMLVAGVLGALFVLKIQGILPYALCFAAGAMIFVVVEELIPESQRIYKHIDLVTMSTMTGFSVMMILDVALG